MFRVTELLFVAWFALKYAHARDLSQDRERVRHPTRAAVVITSSVRHCVSPGHMRTIFAYQIQQAFVRMHPALPEYVRPHIHASRCKSACVARRATCDGLNSIRLHVKRFFPRSAPGATLLLPGRVTSLVAGSHYHPYLRGFIAPSAQPSSYFPSYPRYIYIRGTGRVAARRVFLRHWDFDLADSVGER